MPTGYTAGVQDGSITTFRDFAMGCARAFGALVLMRDEPADARIPDSFTPDTSYYDKGLADAQARLAELDTLTDADCEARASAEHAEAVASWHERKARRLTHRTRYAAMLAAVIQWEPPTPDHHGLKDFMVQQLRESIDFDCSETFDTGPVRLSGTAWRDARRAQTARDIARHTESRDDEIRRAAERTAWVQALRTSLPTE